MSEAHMFRPVYSARGDRRLCGRSNLDTLKQIVAATWGGPDRIGGTEDTLRGAGDAYVRVPAGGH
jgi:hypothetical protein